MALAYHYTQGTIPMQISARIIGLPENRVLLLEKVLGRSLLDLLVRDDDGSWRPLHEIIAVEVIEQVLSEGMGNRENWKQNLPKWAREFAEFCNTGDQTISQELTDLLRRLFIYREHKESSVTNETFKEPYSRLIQDIEPPDGKINMFKLLTELFPTESHFWAHFGRCYMQEFGNIEKALVAVNKAIDISKKRSNS